MEFNGVHPSKRDEAILERNLRREYWAPFYNGLREEIKQRDDGSVSTFVAIVTAYTSRFIAKQSDNFPVYILEEWTRKVNNQHVDKFVRDFWRVARVNIRPALQEGTTRTAMVKAINNSVSLIKTIPQRFSEQLREQLATDDQVRKFLRKKKRELIKGYVEGETESPFDLAARERMVRDVGKSSGYNLRRIVRDQNNKLVGELNKVRQTEIGVTQYRWDSSQDSRVRLTHQDMHNEIVNWKDRPVITGHPGEDIQCRCVAIPIITMERLRAKYG